jgi:16S rRNA (guanine527-N7)-methyltransferase
MNLTGLKDEESILRRHFLEPLAVTDLIDQEGTLLDLGSGNGFPAVPLAVLNPGVRLILVEASERKSAFLWAVLRELGLKGARVETRRACRRADLADILPVRWLTFRGIKVQDLIAGGHPDLLEEGGRMLAFVSEGDGEALRKNHPTDLRWTETRRLPSSPGDVVEVFRPGRT